MDSSFFHYSFRRLLYRLAEGYGGRSEVDIIRKASVPFVGNGRF